MNGISALIGRDIREKIYLPVCPVKVQEEGGHCEPGRGPSPQLDHAQL